MSTPDPQRVRDPASDQRSPGPYPPQSSPPRGHPVPLSPRSLPQHITFLLSAHSQTRGRWATREKEPGRQRGVGGNHTRQILEALREKQPEQTMAGADGLRRESGKEGGGESHQRAEGRDLAEPTEALARSSPTGPLLWQRATQTRASQSTEALPTTVRSSVPPALAGHLLSTYFAMWLLRDNGFKVINATSLRYSLQAPLLWFCP